MEKWTKLERRRQAKFGLKLCEMFENADGRNVKLSNGREVKFDMAIYASPCGAVGCALGIAGMEPWFRKRGLKTDRIAGAVAWGDTVVSSDTGKEAFGNYEPFDSWQTEIRTPKQWAAKWRPHFEQMAREAA